MMCSDDEIPTYFHNSIIVFKTHFHMLYIIWIIHVYQTSLHEVDHFLSYFAFEIRRYSFAK